MITIGILTQDPYKTDLSLNFFRQAAKITKVKVKIIDPRECRLLFHRKKIPLSSIYSDLKDIDVILPRLGTEPTWAQFMIGIYVLEYLKKYTNLIILNPPESIMMGNDKIWQNQLLGENKVKIPQTSFIGSEKDIEKKIKKFILPFVVKAPYSYGGKDVHLVKNIKTAKSVVNSYLKRNIPVLIQEYFAIKPVRDYRLFITGDKVIAAIIRQAKEKEFRANTSLGASRWFFDPEESLKKKAVKISKIIGLDIAAVDFIKYKNEYYFLEINPSPGVFGALKNNLISKEILRYCQEQIKNKS